MSHRGSHSKVRRSLFAVLILAGMLTLLSAAPAFAFSTEPHIEMLDDAAGAEGFSEDATMLMGNDNSFMDFYQWAGASANPYSGHGTSKLARLLVGNFHTENWPMAVIAAASRGHFDSNPDGPGEGLSPQGLMQSLGNTAGITAEWQRLQRSVWTCLQEAHAENNPQKALECLGASSHEVQDFYAHTNWVEPMPGHGLAGSEGPGWHENGFGTYPTWYDVPADEREKFMIYGDSTPGHTRRHGWWQADNNESVVSAMNKDSPPRPYYLEASVTAYFATRQWIQACRSWLNDDAFWQRMQSWQVKGGKQKELEEDAQGLFEIMRYSGRWGGQGEVTGAPGPSGAAGDLLELRDAVVHYMGDEGKTSFRERFERMIVRLTNPTPTGKVAPIPSSQELQRQMEIVVMRVTRMASVGTFGLGDVWPDQADMYAEMEIDGQEYVSDVIHGHNEFTFDNPYEPFTIYKVIPKDTVEPEPVESIEVELKTSCDTWSGTDDTVYLRLGKDLRFALNKRETNDFERCDDDTYSVPIDDAVRHGLRVGDITGVWIEKSGDGIAGSWKLGGVKLTVNGKQVYSNMDVNRWIEDGHLSWEAKNFVPRNPTGPKIPIWLQLREDDFDGLNSITDKLQDVNPYNTFSGGDDQGDINPYDKRDTVAYGYVPGRKVERTYKGANQLGGRIGFGGDLASVTFTLETLIPELIGTSGPVQRRDGSSPPPPAAGKPDLLITDLREGSVTVENAGESAAGAFRLVAQGSGGNGEDTLVFSGLAAGATQTRALGAIPPCEGIEATVDDLEQVDEADESNNTARSGQVSPSCPHSVTVPEVEGDTEAVAMQKIDSADLNANALPQPTSICDDIGLVMSQSPHSGTSVQSGSFVTIGIGARDPKHPCR